ncbi:MAG: hypothetical protein R2688_07275 [Fimbriimonadaceae bacterium]
MRRVWLMGLIGLVALGGCQVRKIEEPSGGETVNSEEHHVNPLDMSNSFLAEITTEVDDLGKGLKVVSEFDSHHEWQDDFIQDTIKEIKSSVGGQALESKMHMESDRGAEEVQIKIIKADDGKAILRVITSYKPLSDQIQAGFD